MNATYMSSLARFDNHSLLHTLRHSRWMRAQAEQAHGYTSVEHRASLSSLHCVVVELESRGLPVPESGAELSCRCAG